MGPCTSKKKNNSLLMTLLSLKKLLQVKIRINIIKKIKYIKR